MGYEYFYGIQADQFTFYRVPKLFFTQKEYRCMTTDDKLLYGMLLDRMNLSAKNGWQDQQGRVYIIYPIEEIMADMGCADNKATKLLDDLEKRYGLIERKRQGLGKPNLIYVKNFATGDTGPPEQRFQNRENNDSGVVKIMNQEAPKSRCNNTDINNTENSDTDRIYPGNGCDPMAKRTEYREYFEKALELDLYRKNHPYHIHYENKDRYQETSDHEPSLRDFRFPDVEYRGSMETNGGSERIPAVSGIYRNDPGGVCKPASGVLCRGHPFRDRCRCDHAAAYCGKGKQS